MRRTAQRTEEGSEKERNQKLLICNCFKGMMKCRRWEEEFGFRICLFITTILGIAFICFSGPCKSALMLLRHYCAGCQKDIQSTAPMLEVWSSRQKYFSGMDYPGTPYHLTTSVWLALPCWLATLLCGEKDSCCTAPLHQCHRWIFTSWSAINQGYVFQDAA